ncbi:MAG: redoxin domain-containing protein [Alphaproteobacteria bacterium]|nr:redoxin domain-containing protein [Alphaproteobacteria bacterium]
MTDRSLAPELQVSRWFNARAPITLGGLRGKIVVVHAFQMLCPGCVAHSIPQARKLHEIAKGSDIVVLGLHTVFEHHAAMTPVSLEAFLHEYQITFPVGVDQPGEGHPIPKTMAAYGMRGTPTTIVIDREGRIARHSFGAEDDLAFGLFLGRLAAAHGNVVPATEAGICRIDDGCVGQD